MGTNFSTMAEGPSRTKERSSDAGLGRIDAAGRDGFDVIIHSHFIDGFTKRKGRNNSVTPTG